MSDKAFIYGLIGGAIGSYLTRPKQQPIQQQVQQQIAKMPHEFDYVVDIYTDRIEITDRNGSKTTLNSIDDLNNWLLGINGKDILIWNNGDMEGTLKLTSNRYVINGRPTRFEIVLTQPNIDLYHLTPSIKVKERETNFYTIRNITMVGEPSEYGTIYRPAPIPISNVNIFAVGTTIEISSNPYETNEIYQNIHVTAINSPYISVSGIRGGVIADGIIVQIEKSELIDGLYARSYALRLFDSVIDNYLAIESKDTEIEGNTYLATLPDIDIQSVIELIVNPNASATESLPFDMHFGFSYALEIVNVYERIITSEDNIFIPLNKNEVDIQIDINQKTITVTNKTDREMRVDIILRYRRFS
jgi:hypothetical protein